MPEFGSDAWNELESAVGPLQRAGLFDEAVQLILNELETEMVAERRAILTYRLRDLYALAGRFEKERECIERLIALEPAEPLHRSALALWHSLWTPERPAAALDASERAIETARSTGTWLRHVLLDRCRIALAFARYDLVEAAMAEILAVPFRPEIPDTPIEGEFLSRIPPGAISEDLLTRYRGKLREYWRDPMRPAASDTA